MYWRGEEVERSMRCVVERGGGGEVYEVCSGEGVLGRHN